MCSINLEEHDSNWLRCDGRTLLSSEYPDAADILALKNSLNIDIEKIGAATNLSVGLSHSQSSYNSLGEDGTFAISYSYYNSQAYKAIDINTKAVLYNQTETPSSTENFSCVIAISRNEIYYFSTDSTSHMIKVKYWNGSQFINYTNAFPEIGASNYGFGLIDYYIYSGNIYAAFYNDKALMLVVFRYTNMNISVLQKLSGNRPYMATQSFFMESALYIAGLDKRYDLVLKSYSTVTDPNILYFLRYISTGRELIPRHSKDGTSVLFSIYTDSDSYSSTLPDFSEHYQTNIQILHIENGQTTLRSILVNAGSSYTSRIVSAYIHGDYALASGPIDIQVFKIGASDSNVLNLSNVSHNLSKPVVIQYSDILCDRLTFLYTDLASEPRDIYRASINTNFFKIPDYVKTLNDDKYYIRVR